MICNWFLLILTLALPSPFAKGKMIFYHILPFTMAKRNFKFTVRDGIEFDIQLGKATESKTSLSRGTPDGRPTYMINVLGAEDKRPISVSSIDRVVQFNELTTFVKVKDDTGEEVRLPVDKRALQKLYPNSDKIRVEGVIALSRIKPRMYDGSHYYVQLRRATKTKPVNPQDRTLYTIVYRYLQQTECGLLVSYTNSNRPKHGIVYTDDEEGLMMSHLIHSNYQREMERPKLDALDDYLTYGKRLFKGLRLKEIPEDSIVDRYEMDIKNNIDKAIEDWEQGKVSLPPASTHVPANTGAGADGGGILSLIMQIGDSSDEDDPSTPKEKTPTSDKKAKPTPKRKRNFKHLTG